MEQQPPKRNTIDLSDVLANAKDATRLTWQYRAVEATRGNQSQLGAMLIAALNKLPANPPRFGRGGATITSDHIVVCDFQSRDGRWTRGAVVCDVDDLIRNFRGLADHLKLSDADRVDMFQTVQKWIAHDYRIKKELF